MGEKKEFPKVVKEKLFSLMDEWWESKESDFLSKYGSSISEETDSVLTQDKNEEYSELKKRYEELEEKCRSLKQAYKNIEIDKTKVEELLVTLQKDRDTLLEENVDLKHKLFDCENKYTEEKINSEKIKKEWKEQQLMLTVCSSYLELKNLLDVINTLSATEQDTFNCIFKNTTDPMICLIECTRNLSEVYATLQREVAQRNVKHIELCRKLFVYLVEQFNRTYDTPIYIMFSPNVGDNFDSDEHVKLNSSNSRGKVKDILIPGFKSRKGEAVFKSIVEII